MIFYTSNDGYTTDPFSIEKVLFLENNYWDENRMQIKFDEGYLVYVDVNLTKIEDHCQFKELYPTHSFYDRGKNKYYSFLYSHDVDRILSILRSQDEKQLSLRFDYKFTDVEYNIPIDRKYLGRFYVPVKRYENFKIINSQVSDNIKFREFGPDSYLICVKEKLRRIFNAKYVILENFESVLDANFENQPPKFKLHHFDSISSCLDNFKAFVNFLNILKCSKEDSNIIDSSKNVFEKTYLDQYLSEKIKNDFKNEGDADLRTQQVYEQVDLLSKKCYNEIMRRLSTNILILPVRDSYTKEFYFDQFYKLIKENIGKMIENIEKSYKDSVPYINHLYFERFESDISKFGSAIINESWESLKIVDYFTVLIGKEIKNIEDYLEVDKILCDFKKMMCFAEGLKNDQIRDEPGWYGKLMFIDNFDCQIVGGIEVSLENPVQFGGIKAFDSTGKKITMNRNFDFFVRVYMKKCRVSLTFERIRERDIQEIEVISVDKKYRKRFNVSGYLDEYN